MHPSQVMQDIHTSRDNIPRNTGRKVQFQDLPARMQTSAFARGGGYSSQFEQYQGSNATMRDNSYSFDQHTPTRMADEEWECGSSHASLHLDGGQDDPDPPKPKKTRKRKPKAPVDQETAQRRRREALDKNKQAAAKCRARKKAEESKKQQDLQTLKRENQMLHTILFQMEEQVKNAKLEIARHADCDDDALLNARKLIEGIESNCQRLKEERSNIQTKYNFAKTESEDEMLDESGEFESMYGNGDSGENALFGGSGEFDAMQSNAGLEEDGLMSRRGKFDGAVQGHDPGCSNTATGLKDKEEHGTTRHEYSSLPFTSTVPNGIGSKSSAEATVNPLWVSTEILAESTESSMFVPVSASGGSFDASPTEAESYLRGGSIYPDLPSPTAGPGYECNMPMFDPSDQTLATSSLFNTNFDTSLSIFDEYGLDMPQQDARDQMNGSEMDILSQMDSAYESLSPGSSTCSKRSPPWEALKLNRPQLDPLFRRDSALGPEVNELQLLKDLQEKRFPFINPSAETHSDTATPSLLERRRRRTTK